MEKNQRDNKGKTTYRKNIQNIDLISFLRMLLKIIILIPRVTKKMVNQQLLQKYI